MTKRSLVFRAVASFVLFVVLGLAVKRYGEPETLLQFEHAIVNHGDLVAWWLTWFGWIDVLAPLCIVALLAGVIWPEWRARAIFSVVLVILAWGCSDLAQHLFARPRRMDWFVKHETAFSYPSTHAAVAFSFYWLWGVMLWRSRLPQFWRAVGFGTLAALALAICWARLSLGAHYVTDIAGGALLAFALTSGGYALPFLSGRLGAVNGVWRP